MSKTTLQLRKAPLQMRMIALVLAVLCGLWLVTAAGLFAVQRQMQFAPGHRAPSPAEAGFDGAAEVWLTAADGTAVLIWYAPARSGAATVLFFHGKGGEIADRPRRWATYRAAGLGVAFLSYRGYGASLGQPSEAGFHQDADAAYDWLLRQGVAPADIAVVGESLGTGVAVRLAADRSVGALLLEAPYTSVADVAALRFFWLPVRALILDPFPSIDRIGRVTAPLLVQHGTADSRIPVDMGQRLFAAAAAASFKQLILRPGLDHLNLFGPDTWAAEIAFLAALRRPE